MCLSGVVQDKRVVSGWTGDKRRSPVLRAEVDGKRAAEVQRCVIRDPTYLPRPAIVKWVVCGADRLENLLPKK